MKPISLAGTTSTNLNVASTFDGAEYVRVSNISAAEISVIVAGGSMAGTVTLESLDTIILQKATTDTVRVAANNTTTANAVAVRVAP